VIRKQLWRLPEEAAHKHRPKSERSQISHHPGGPCNQESQHALGPIEMRLWVSDQLRNPHQHAKDGQHKRHQTYRKPRPSIDENGIAASANAIVVRIAQNIWLGGIHFGTR